MPQPLQKRSAEEQALRGKLIELHEQKKRAGAALQANTTPKKQCRRSPPPSPERVKKEVEPTAAKPKRSWECKVEVKEEAKEEEVPILPSPTEHGSTVDEGEEEENEENESPSEEEEDSLANGPRGDSASWFPSEV